MAGKKCQHRFLSLPRYLLKDVYQWDYRHPNFVRGTERFVKHEWCRSCGLLKVTKIVRRADSPGEIIDESVTHFYPKKKVEV